MNMNAGSALIYSVLGMLVVFFALILLMVCIKVLIAVTDRKKKAEPALAAAADAPAPAAPAAKAPEAKGTAGDVKLYDTDPKDAAMVMAIVADTLGKPLNELRFKSIKEVEE